MVIDNTTLVQVDELNSLEAEIIAVKRELLSTGLQLERSLHSKQLENFIPSPKQYQFFEHANSYGRAGFCGNRFGKSTIGVVEDCSWLLGYRPFFPDGHPLRRLGIPTHGVKGLVIAEDWEKSEDIFTNQTSKDRPGKFFEFLPESNIKGIKRGQHGHINLITVENMLDGVMRESNVHIDTVRSYISNPRSFESSDWDFIHIDEPVPKALWTAVSRGLIDRKGKFWWLLTPLGFPWMYDETIENAKRNPKSYWYFEATMDDNPTLDEEAKTLYLDQLPEEERECRRRGIPLAHGRRVYGFYDEAFHNWKDPNPPKGWLDWDHPPEDYLCGYALDPHPQTPHAVLFTAIAPNGDIYFYDEIFEKCLIDELAKNILSKISKVRVGWQLCDPCASIENPETGRSWAMILNEHGLEPLEASKSKREGIVRTQQIFSPRYHRRVWVMPKMYNFKREIRQYIFDKENKPVDKDDHMMENMYRTVVFDDLTYYPPPPKRPKQGTTRDEFWQSDFSDIQFNGL